MQKLRVDDLQSETGYFDGVMVYAQNKVAFQNITQRTIHKNDVLSPYNFEI